VKKFWVIVLCLAVVGAGLMIGGYFLGADTDIYIDESGFNIGNDDDYKTISQRDTEEISAIEIDTASTNIEIIPSDEYGFDITGRSLEYSFENGTLEVTQKNTFFKWHLFGINAENDSIRIYLPGNAHLENVSINNSSGKLNISGFNADKVDVDLTSGRTIIHSVKAGTLAANSSSGDIKITDTSADKFDINLTSGDLSMSGIDSNGYSARLTSGSARLEGDFRGDSIIEVTSGNVNMDIEGDKSDYRRFISITSGSASVDGDRDDLNDSNTGASNSIEINVTSGSAEINFGK
jgi:DUF4097 and DUF4098 domain-containing protein YvlB